MKFATLTNSGILRCLAIGALALATYSASAQTFVHEGLIYKNSKGNLTLQKPGTKVDAGETVSAYDGDYVIPQKITYNGTEYTVTSIAAAFKGTDVKSVVLPTGVSISRGGFQNCTSLTSCVLPPDISNLQGDVFNGCSALESISIPGTVKELQSNVLKDCSSLKTVVIEDGETAIEMQSESFGGTEGKVSHVIEHLTINRAIGTKYTAMNTKPFRNSTLLKDVTIGGSCTSLPESYFESASGLESVTITSNFTSFGSATFQSTALTSFTMPEGVTTVVSSLFAGCKQLKTVVLGEGITSIGAMAFQNSGLESITLPAGLKSIAQLAFSGTKLTGEIVIPDAVTSIGVQAYAGNTGITAVKMPATITSIGTGAFMNCPALASFTIDAACEAYASSADNKYIATKDGSTVLVYAPAADGADFSGDYTTVESYAFYGATKLQNVSLPKCQNWGDYAFYGSGIKELTVRGTMGRYIAANCPALASVTVDSGEVPVGIAANCAELTDLVLPRPVAVIRQDALKNCAKVTNLDLGSILSILETDCFTGAGIKTLSVGTFYPAAMADGVFTAESNITVTVPTSLVETYKAADGWSYLNIVGDDNIAVGGETMGMPDGLYYAGDDNNLHCVYSDGLTDDYEVGLQHMFQLTQFSHRIYGTSAGKKFWYSSSSATEGDGKLFYISKVGDEVFQAVVLDNAGNNAYKDPTGLYIYGSDLYVNDRNVCIRKISASAIALPQSYPSWMENNWMAFYNNPWTYGCIKNGFAITSDKDSEGNTIPRYWVGMKYNGCGLYSFLEKNIGSSSENVGPEEGLARYFVKLTPIATSFAIDEKNGHLYMYIETAGNQNALVKGGLYRFNLSDLAENPDPSPSEFVELAKPQLIDGSPVKYEGNATNEHVGISQLAMDENGEYLYWCYRAPTAEEAAANEAQDYSTTLAGKYWWADTYNAENPLHHSGIKRIKLGEENPTVEMVVPDVTGYGIVTVNYEGSTKPQVGVSNVKSDMVAAISINGSEITANEDTNIAIYNAAGMIVNMLHLNAGQSINTDALNNGVYIIEARTAAGRQALKIAK